jgi:5-methyltetrahydropteroyltriglutamate--homocysteine methyltransferase
MPLPTEPIGSIPRSKDLLNARERYYLGSISKEQLQVAESEALRETISLFEDTGSPIITDGEQSKPRFATYPLDSYNLKPDGIVIPFADGQASGVSVA